MQEVYFFAIAEKKKSILQLSTFSTEIFLILVEKVLRGTVRRSIK